MKPKANINAKRCIRQECSYSSRWMSPGFFSSSFGRWDRRSCCIDIRRSTRFKWCSTKSCRNVLNNSIGRECYRPLRKGRGKLVSDHGLKRNRRKTVYRTRYTHTRTKLFFTRSFSWGLTYGVEFRVDPSLAFCDSCLLVSVLQVPSLIAASTINCQTALIIGSKTVAWWVSRAPAGRWKTWKGRSPSPKAENRRISFLPIGSFFYAEIILRISVLSLVRLYHFVVLDKRTLEHVTLSQQPSDFRVIRQEQSRLHKWSMRQQAPNPIEHLKGFVGAMTRKAYREVMYQYVSIKDCCKQEGNILRTRRGSNLHLCEKQKKEFNRGSSNKRNSL